MNESCDNCPKKYQDAADTWDRSKYSMHNGRNNVKKKPPATKDDRLHGVKPDEAVSFFENVENDATDQWDTGDGCSYVRRQTRRSGCSFYFRFRTGRRWRLGRIDWIGHDLHTQTWKCFVKQSSRRWIFAF